MVSRRGSGQDVFAQAPQVAAEAEALLVDAEWLTPQPLVVEIQPNGVDGNGCHDEADEPQQSLFSWAEFMAEESVKPKRRSRKPEPASISLFEWALER